MNSATDASTLLASMTDDLAHGMLPLRVFNNREIYDLELRRIFARSWMFIGHESELRKPGDYAQRTIAQLAQTPDAREGAAAFLEKRKPKWSEPGS